MAVPLTTRPELHGTFGVVPSTHWLASAAGMRSQAIAALEPFFRDEWPTSAATWLPVPEPGSLFRNPVLAETLHRRRLQRARR